MSKAKTVLRFKITLDGSAPKIWRRIVVPSGYSFFDLHCAIQDAMGWSDSHLHGFYIAQKGTARPIVIMIPDPENDFEMFRHESLDERKEKIADYFPAQIKQCKYTYDFGDSWDHTVLFEKELPIDANTKYPICAAGKNACPVEDCGGLWGYDNLIETLKNPMDKEHKDMCECLGIEAGDEIDPAEFDLSEVVFASPKEHSKRWEQIN